MKCHHCYWPGAVLRTVAVAAAVLLAASIGRQLGDETAALGAMRLEHKVQALTASARTVAEDARADRAACVVVALELLHAELRPVLAALDGLTTHAHFSTPAGDDLSRQPAAEDQTRSGKGAVE